MGDNGNLIVTLTDKNFVPYAKQLFSSIYWNAGWQGDYLLLSHQVPEVDIQWFRNKGIYVKECEPLYEKSVGYENFPPVVLDLFYLFTPEFKKWKNIIFLDADIIVRASLESLTNVSGLCSAHVMNDRLFMYFQKESLIDNYKKLSKKFDLNSIPFNSGVMAFSTTIIEKNTFDELMNLFFEYEDIGSGNDPILNLWFYKKWRKLPSVYDITPLTIEKHTGISANKLKGIIIHLKNDELNNSKLIYQKEWSLNLNKADKIDLSLIQKAKKWSRFKILYYSFYLNIFYQKNKFFKRVCQINIKSYLQICLKITDRLIGRIGEILKITFPRLYCFLKKIYKFQKK